MKDFITNNEKLIERVINAYLPNASNFDVLVGYFYFTGFDLLAENLIEKDVRILVGMNVGRDINNKLAEGYLIQTAPIKKPNQSKEEIKISTFKSIKDLINNTDYLDNEENQRNFNIFKEKIINGTLQIRKTIEPNHAKMYIFKNKEGKTFEGTQPGTVITGSSNLTYSGLKGRKEINVLMAVLLFWSSKNRIYY